MRDLKIATCSWGRTKDHKECSNCINIYENEDYGGDFYER